MNVLRGIILFSVCCFGSVRVAYSATNTLASFNEKSSKDVTIPKPGTPEYEKANNHRLLLEEMAMQRAWMYSALLPGAGQIYNQQSYRLLVLYPVFAGLGYGAYYWHIEYVRYDREGGTTCEQLAHDYKRLRDIFMLFAGLWYIVNIFDAYVNASLKSFDVSDDIGLKIQPIVMRNRIDNSYAFGLGVHFYII